ncbi:MAG: peptide ABC transporter substrate-binding protein [Acidimicrobiales bacterium]
MRLKRRGIKLLALFLGLSLVAAACGDDGDEGSEGTDDATEETTDEGDAAGVGGGEFIDLGTIVGDPLEYIDPALNTTLDAFQIITALYDGLTDISLASGDPEIVPDVAESYEASEDAITWTFQIREGVTFSNGEDVLPSSFANAWERASDPEFAGDYSYLFNFIDGGAEKLAGEADTLAGVEADDEAMTLTVTLAEPYANFDAVAGFQLFMPMPLEATEAEDFSEWENGLMIGNGPYMMESARNSTEIVLVKNEDWAGTAEGETFDDRLDRIEFRVSADPDTAYNAFEAGEGHNANIPPALVTQAQEDYATTLDSLYLGTYHWVFNDRDPLVGGEENLALRQAISLSIDREDINESVYNGSRTTSTGIVPEGIPGWQEGICEYCGFDLEAATAKYQEWLDAGNTQSEPIPVQFNADAGHEPVVAIMVDNMKAAGIDAVAEPMVGETYFSDLADGACVFCRSGWIADYPTYDNFMYDLFHGDALDGNNYGFVNEEFDALVDEGKQTVDKDEQADLFNQAEQILLNEATMAVPINWYRGDYVYDPERVAEFPQEFGIIKWERVRLAE